MQILNKAALLAAALPLLAGGFYLELGSPSANKDPKARNAVLVTRFTGCHHPEKGTLQATAEGVVNGQRNTVTLTPVALAEPGMYAIEREWPAEGKWVVRLVGNHPDVSATTSLMVRVDGDKFDGGTAKFAMRAPAANELDTMLR